AAGIALLLKKGEAGDVYNVCSGRAVKVREVLGALLRLAGLEGKVCVLKEEREKDLIPYQRGSLAKIRALGWWPRFSLEKSLSDAWKAWCGKDA
ncbi:MAG: hypothetical protein O2807_09315, partial [bacterium]|nr:hypothetical protein [bacterium]